MDNNEKNFENDFQNLHINDESQPENTWIREIASLVLSKNIEQQIIGTQKIRKLSSIERNPPIKEIVDANLVPQLVEFLHSNNENLQFEAAWAITNILSGPSREIDEFVIYLGVVPIFINLVSSKHDEVQEQAVWALGNIAVNNPGLLLDHGILTPLLGLISKQTRLSLTRNAMWCLSNICGKKTKVEFSRIEPALSVLAKSLFNNDIEVLADACWAFSYLSNGSGEEMHAQQKIIEANVCPRLVELLAHESSVVVVPVLRTVGNIISGDDSQTQVLLNCNILPILLQLLNSPKGSIRRETCWTLSNITAGTTIQKQAVIDANIFPKIIQIAGSNDNNTKKEAAWVIANAINQSTCEQMSYLDDLNITSLLCDLLAEFDIYETEFILEALENLLKSGRSNSNNDKNPYALKIQECSGLDKIKYLKSARNSNVSVKALKIIETYFPEKNDNF